MRGRIGLFLENPILTETYAFGLRAFGCTIQASASSRETHSIIDRYIFPTLPRIGANNLQPNISVCVDENPGEFRLSVDGEVVASAGEAIALVPNLIHAIDEAVVRRLLDLRAVHAGTIVWNGHALLLPGSTHSGKSSLVAELLRRGATYFSDEYALIDPDGRVHPYPRPLLLRSGSPEQTPALPAKLNAAAGDASAPVGWILLLKYSPDTQWQIAPVEQSLALMALLTNTPHNLSDSPELIGMFERAVSGAACYAGQRGEAASAVDEILRLIG
jgi:hypothetical protein